jgi:UDP-N-acetylmuramate dehydrogenase
MNLAAKEINLENFKYKGKLEKNVSLAKYTTWHVGGFADFVFKPKNLQDLSNFLTQLYDLDKEISIHWLGLGSNVLIRDTGLRGIVILTNNGKEHGLNTLEMLNDSEFGEVVHVGAGIPCAKLAKFLVDQHYNKAAFWAGIPGTMGGALAMNAGCYGSETWDFVVKLEVINRAGELKTIYPDDFDVHYRSITLREPSEELWFVGAWLKLIKSNIDADLGRQEIKQLLQKRSSAQPIGQFSGGSVFKNPKGDYSARLVETAGLKGYRIGGAYVSEKHANFIINDKTATAEDIEQLIAYIQDVIFNKFNIKLEPEVKMLG